MASLPNFFLLLLLTFLALTHARNTQFFSKVPATNHNLDLPNFAQQDPKFSPDNANGYGLYSHVSGQEQELGPEQLPPSTMANTDPSIQTTPNIVPKNYNPVEHLIKPEELTVQTFSPNGVANSFNSQPEGFTGTEEQYFNNGGGLTQQGMSDTRFLENGKYFYDVSTEMYSSNHPYERLGGARNEYKNVNYNYGNGGEGDEFGRENPMWGNHNQNQYKFQGEETSDSSIP